MRFLVQHSLIQMGNAPSLWNMILKQLCKLLTGLFCHSISPGTERHQKLSGFIKRHITMHHSAESNGCKFFHRNTIFSLYIFYHVLIAFLNPCPDCFLTVSPDVVHQLIFPLMTSGRNGLVLFIYQNCLDSGRTKLNTKHRFSTYYYTFICF